MDDFRRSLDHQALAALHLPGGVSSTPRAAQRPAPLLAEHAEGAWITDADGNRVIDYALGYGPLILGHSPEPVLRAIRAELDHGLRTASMNRAEAQLAALVAACIPSAERTAFVSTGTEAVQLALRVARAGTGRNGVVKFRANYHGWADGTHVANAPGQDGPGTAGQDPGAARSLTILDWGDADALALALDGSHAAVLLEPVAMNAGCFTPPPGFLDRVRALTRASGTLLVFDEVITGFRLGLAGAQGAYGVAPDLTVLGKALGGGLPIGAVCGTASAMRPLSDGTLSHRGTFNGNPLSMAAGVACVTTLQAGGGALFARLARHAETLAAHVDAEAGRLGVPACARQAGPALQLFGGARRVDTIDDLRRTDPALTARLTEQLLRRGVQAIPRGLMYLSTAHGDAEIALTLAAITGALEACRGTGAQAGACHAAALPGR